MMIPTYHFYCAECETKTKAKLYFRTHCQCGESNVLATFDYIEYYGMAVDQESWEAMDAKPKLPVWTIDFDVLRKHR